MTEITLSNSSKTNIYPLFLKSELVKKEPGVRIVNFVLNGDETPSIMPGDCTVFGWNVPQSEVLEVLEERPAKGEHQIQNPIFFSVKCKAK